MGLLMLTAVKVRLYERMNKAAAATMKKFSNLKSPQHTPDSEVLHDTVSYTERNKREVKKFFANGTITL
jgi:hypothetical protein